MSGLQALVVANPRLAAAQPHCIRLFFQITAGAVTQLLTSDLPPVIVGVASGDFTQAAVNRLLEKDSTGADLSAASTAEVDVATAFGATAMGVDSIGFVISTNGQFAKAACVVATLNTVAPRVVAQTTSLPNTLTSGLLVTPAGNLAGRVVLTGLDAATGVLVLEIYVWSK